VDTTAPATPAGIALTAATDTGASASDGVTANNQPSLTGAATAGSLVTVYIDGTAVGTTTADGTGAWQYNLAGRCRMVHIRYAPPRQIPQATSVPRRRL
jgi:hypothetical protein